MLGSVFCPGFVMWFFVFFNPFKINGISHIKFDTVQSGWPIVYIEGSKVIIPPPKKKKQKTHTHTQTDTIFL